VTPLRNFAPRAVRDVEDAADWLADGPGGEPLARRFLVAVAEAAGRISQRPLLGHRRLELLPDPYRFYPVRGFPYLLVYNTARAGAPVARVPYMGRDLATLLADLRDHQDEPER
jgi:toxin ParE1/3/4